MAASQLHCCYQARPRPHLLLKSPPLFRQLRLPSLPLSPLNRPPIPWLGLSMCAREVYVTDAVQNEKALGSSGNGAHIDTHVVEGNGLAAHVASSATADDNAGALDVDEENDEEEDGLSSYSSSQKQKWDDDAITSAQETYGEVSKIIASRAIDHRMFYLIEWKDGHEPSWLPATSIAKDVLAEYDSNWWKAARAGDDAKLKELLNDEGRDADAVDENGRTALLFAAGIGSEKCVRVLVEAGADVDGQDPDGLTPLHMATGYARQNSVSVLLALGADPEVADSKGRTPITLAQELVDRIPKANPLQFARRLAFENILKQLESEVYETVEVEQVLDRRSAANNTVQYLVKWKDGTPEEWIPAENVADDLIKDYEAGLEYGIAEEILEKREEEGKVEYLVRWADAEEPSWEPFENVAAELIADFEKMPVAEVEKKQQKQLEA